MPDGMHDPGGKVRLAMPPGMRGGALFAGPGDCYRTLLWREWGSENAPYALFIGMNPSTASGEVDDPTIRREVGFCKRWGLTAYYKANISAYRATDPKRLRGAPIRCEDNLRLLLPCAGNAAGVVLAFGVLSGEMRVLASEVVSALKGVKLLCLGTTADGSPRHPLYLANTANLIEWKGWRA